MKYIGTARVAEILNVSQGTIRRWCNEGKFKTARQDGKGRPWIILEEEVFQFAKKRGKKA